MMEGACGKMRRRVVGLTVKTVLGISEVSGT